jgi:hypothetical protein
VRMAELYIALDRTPDGIPGSRTKTGTKDQGPRPEDFV